MCKPFCDLWNMAYEPTKSQHGIPDSQTARTVSECIDKSGIERKEMLLSFPEASSHCWGEHGQSTTKDQNRSCQQDTTDFAAGVWSGQCISRADKPAVTLPLSPLQEVLFQ